MQFLSFRVIQPQNLMKKVSTPYYYNREPERNAMEFPEGGGDQGEFKKVTRKTKNLLLVLKNV